MVPGLRLRLIRATICTTLKRNRQQGSIMNGVVRFGLYVVSILCFANLQAEITPDMLIKVTKDNNPDCVEYYSYKDDMYCTTTAQGVPVDPAIKDKETQHIIFDERPWQAAWGQMTDTITTIEYIPAGEDINNWHELITSQFLPGLQNKMTLEQYSQNIMGELQKTGLNPVIKIIDTKPDSILFEFQILDPENLRQDELQKIVQGKDGFYVLHYTIKKPDMGQENRDKWIKNIQSSSIK